MGLKEVLCKLRGHKWAHGCTGSGDTVYSDCSCCGERRIYAFIQTLKKDKLIKKGTRFYIINPEFRKQE